MFGSPDRAGQRLRRPAGRGPRVVFAVTVLLASFLVMSGSSASGQGGHFPQAVTVAGDRSVGPLFPRGMSGAHTCTASVLAGGDGLLLTAAHCLAGTGVGVVFAPGYDGAAADPTPYGVWTVEQVWVGAAWTSAQDPADDYAVLRVADQTLAGKRVSVQDVTGGNSISFGEAVGTTVTVTGYRAGSEDAPISCTTRTFAIGPYPGFHCSGFVSGTSGAPWLAGTGTNGRRTVVGLIGGWHQGGCTDDTSYSSPLNSAAYMLMIRAVLGLAGDTVPAAGGDGC